MKRPAKAAKKLTTAPSNLTDSRSDDRPTEPPVPIPRYPGTIRAATRIALVRALLDERKLRNQFLPQRVLGDAGWDILLTLYLGWCENRMTAVNILAEATAAPKTTTLRWTVALSDLGLVLRSTKIEDRRVTEVGLTAAGLAAIEGYLSALHKLRA